MSQNNHKKLTLSTKLTFGKYKGELIYDLIIKDVQYIDWLMDIWSAEICPKVKRMHNEYWQRRNESLYGKRNDINYAKKPFNRL